MTTQLLSICDQEPIHMLSLVQPNGLLLVFDNSFHILQVSENCEVFFKQKSEEILLRTLDAIFDPILLKKFYSHVEHMRVDERIMSSFLDNCFSNKCQFILHDCDSHLILEICILLDSLDYNKYGTTEAFFQRVMQEYEKPISLDDMLNEMAHTIKEISGHDRVLIYKFDEEFNGTVLTQKGDNFTEDYTGHSFPASDIPVQARRLYLKNRFRVISDVNQESVKITPNINPITNVPLDMSYCYLRSVSSVHIQYLKNMNVAASMSISLIIDNKLWGLIVCHHASACSLNQIVLSLFFQGAK